MFTNAKSSKVAVTAFSLGKCLLDGNSYSHGVVQNVSALSLKTQKVNIEMQTLSRSTSDGEGSIKAELLQKASENEGPVKVEIIYIRHGESAWNEAQDHGGWWGKVRMVSACLYNYLPVPCCCCCCWKDLHNAALVDSEDMKIDTDKFKNKNKHYKDYLNEKRFSRSGIVFTSPLQRTIQTAAMSLGKDLLEKQDIFISENFIEKRNGCCSIDTVGDYLTSNASVFFVGAVKSLPGFGGFAGDNMNIETSVTKNTRYWDLCCSGENLNQRHKNGFEFAVKKALDEETCSKQVRPVIISGHSLYLKEFMTRMNRKEHIKDEKAKKLCNWGAVKLTFQVQPSILKKSTSDSRVASLKERGIELDHVAMLDGEWV